MNAKFRGKKMYLVSLYFDSQTEEVLQKHMDKVAAKTGNMYMHKLGIPPHLTIASCRNDREEELISVLGEYAGVWQTGTVNWAAIGSFKPHVLFLAPVLNQYLHGLCVSANRAIDRVGGRDRTDCYQPFGWMPHTTIARTLSEKQMLTGFHILQANFQPFSGEIVRVGLARSNPYQNIAVV